MVEILNRLTEDRQENDAVFDLLASSLRLLADGVDAFHVTRHYEMALADAARLPAGAVSTASSVERR